MTPGSVAMLLGETTGLRVQTTSPSLGAANVRIQGLRGRYSQLVADGLPLYGAQGDSFSLLQVPPLDLGAGRNHQGRGVRAVRRVGARRRHQSRLTTAGRSRARVARQRDVSVGHGPDVVARESDRSTRHGRCSAATIGQSEQDLDDDGWLDLPGVRSRCPASARLLRITAPGRTHVRDARRHGGRSRGGTAPGGRAAGRHALHGVAEHPPCRRRIRRPLARPRQSRAVAFAGRPCGDLRIGCSEPRPEHGVRSTWFGEASLQGAAGGRRGSRASLPAGSHTHSELPQFDYRFSTPSVFRQDEIALGHEWTLAVSARADVHSEYGSSRRHGYPCSRGLLPAGPFASRQVRARFAPTPFTEETEETGLSRLRPLERPAARAGARRVARRHARRRRRRGHGNRLRLDRLDPVAPRYLDDGSVEFVNAPESTRTMRHRAAGAISSRGFCRACDPRVDAIDGIRSRRERSADRAVDAVACGSMNAIWEGEDWGRFGIEMYFIGKQPLEENPYRDRPAAPPGRRAGRAPIRRSSRVHQRREPAGCPADASTILSYCRRPGRTDAGR